MAIEADLRSVIVQAGSSVADRVYSRIPHEAVLPVILYELVDTYEPQVRPEADDVLGQPTAVGQIASWERCLVKLSIMGADRAQVNQVRDEIKPFLNGFKNSSLMIFWDSFRSEGQDTAVNQEIGAIDLTVFYKGA